MTANEPTSHPQSTELTPAQCLAQLSEQYPAQSLVTPPGSTVPRFVVGALYLPDLGGPVLVAAGQTEGDLLFIPAHHLPLSGGEHS